MDVSSILSQFWSSIIRIFDSAVDYIDDKPAQAAAYIGIGALVVTAIGIIIGRISAKNPNKLAGIQIKEKLEEKAKTTLDMVHNWDHGTRGTLTFTNIGKSTATDIKIKVTGYAYPSHWAPITSPACKEGDSLWFKRPHLAPSKKYEVQISWDHEEQAEVEWHWVNADRSPGYRRCNLSLYG